MQLKQTRTKQILIVAEQREQRGVKGYSHNEALQIITESLLICARARTHIIYIIYNIISVKMYI